MDFYVFHFYNSAFITIECSVKICAPDMEADCNWVCFYRTYFDFTTSAVKCYVDFTTPGVKCREAAVERIFFMV